MKKRILVLLLAVLLSLLLCGCSLNHNIDQQMTYEISFMAAMEEVYRILRVVSIGAGAVSISISAIVMIVGNEQQTQKAKKAILYAILAVAVINILPYAIRFGKNLFENVKPWSPDQIK